MRKKQKSMLALAMITAFIATALFLPGLVSAGDLEPSAAPGPTMKTLDQIPPTWSQILPASERFEDVMGGEAVLDKETGLVWAKDANLAMTSGYSSTGTMNWYQAVDYCRNLDIASRKGWRLPSIEELSSLMDTSQTGAPAVPSGVFDNVQCACCVGYWSCTTDKHSSDYAWLVWMDSGLVWADTEVPSNGGGSYYVWPVRGGLGYAGQ